MLLLKLNHPLAPSLSAPSISSFQETCPKPPILNTLANGTTFYSTCPSIHVCRQPDKTMITESKTYVLPQSTQPSGSNIVDTQLLLNAWCPSPFLFQWHHPPTVTTMRWNTVQTCPLRTPRPQHSVLHPLHILEIQGSNPSPRTEYVPIRDLARDEMSLLRNRQERIALRNTFLG